MHSFLRLWLCLPLLLGSGLGAQGLLKTLTESEAPQQGAVRIDAVVAELVSAQTAVVAGRPARLGLRLRHDSHWHTYWENPGDSGLPTRISWKLSSGAALTASEIRWPTPDRLAVGPLASFGYEGDLLLMQTVEIPADTKPGESIDLIAQAEWLVCREVCIPGQASLLLRLPVVPPTESIQASADLPLFEAAERRLPRPDQAGQGFAFEADRLVLWGLGDARGMMGLLFPRTEGLIQPAAAQLLSSTATGWRLDVPLADSAKRLIPGLRDGKTLEAVWRPDGAAQGLFWTLSLDAPPTPTAVIRSSPTAAEAGGGSSGIGVWLAIGMAFVGGLILNLMPCVFPVLGLKLLAFGQRAHSAVEARLHALLFATGVIISMLLLASLLLLLRAAGESIGWGFQLQNPWVVSGLGLLFVVIGLNLTGLFEVGTSLTRAGSLDRREGKLGALSSGALAVVVASPCTAPFMGSALGYAITASVWESMLVFAALGAGLAAPYVLLVAIPSAQRLLPRPGAWMETFRQALSFPMFATAAWLTWVLSQQNGATASFMLLLAMIALAIAGWSWGRSQRRGRLLRTDSALVILSLLTSIGLVQAGSQSSMQQDQRVLAAPAASWGPWAAGLAEQLQAQGKVVFVDFTAAWCISCQANKARVLTVDPVASRLAQPAVATLTADWTRQDPAITAELERHGRSGVPMYLVYPRGVGQPLLLGEWLTDAEVMDALDRAGAPAVAAPGR